MRRADGDSHHCGPDDCRVAVDVHSVGHGRNPARDGLRYIDGDIEPAAGDRQLHATRDGGVSVARHNNVQGASDHGAMPGFFPGYQKVDDAEIRAKFEKAWRATLPAKPGLDNHQMIDGIHDGSIKAMYVFGEEMSLVDSNANYVSAALAKLDFFVMQEIFFSETCRFADVILPASPSLEKEGTFTSTERRIQRLYRAMEPLGDSRPDWQIIQDIANRLGRAGVTSIRRRFTRRLPADTTDGGRNLRAIGRLQVVAMASGRRRADQPLLYTRKFDFPDGKARLFPVPCQSLRTSRTPNMICI